MSKNIWLLRILRLYKVLFAAASIATIAFFAVGIFALVVDSFYGKAENLSRFSVGYCVFIIIACRYFVWFKISAVLISVVNRFQSSVLDAAGWSKLSSLLFISFAIDLVEKFFLILVPFESAVSFKNAVLPDSSMDWPRYCLAIFQVFVKYFAELSEFLIPMTYGLVSIALAILIRFFINKSVAKSNGVKTQGNSFE